MASRIWGPWAGGSALPYVYLAAMALMLWLLNQARRSFWLCALLAWPGTVCHEACHWLVGRLLNGQPVHFTVLPRREGRGFVLGSVALRNLRWYNAFFVGLAPLILLPLAYGLLLWRLGRQPAFGWAEACIVFLLANLVFASVPSWQDLRVAARSPVGWLLLAGALGWGWMRYGAPALDPSHSKHSTPKETSRAPGANGQRITADPPFSFAPIRVIRGSLPS
ncbi:hypothetical protein GETHLI_12750 [Geothrix limicola]|uniref:Uncharacterized protein n=2 Tax=Geothrix limicola TaxID=2927978 RepID=A0ABQ5QDN5_9BACT|nr:hypothetical protein GETHLI_12750 [Geothrix limicola]